MKLILIRGWDGQDELISHTPTENLITELINSLNWERFNSVRLEIDEENWMDVSGNFSPNGLAIVYQENKYLFVSENEPENIKVLKSALHSYLRGNEAYKKMKYISYSHATTHQEKSKSYELWKVRYAATQAIEKRNKIIATTAAILILAFSGAFIYLLFTGEIKFIGHDVGYTTATVTEVKWRKVPGGYIQNVKYEFKYQQIKYVGYFKGTKLTGMYFMNDLINVKFTTDDPNISKRITTAAD